MRVPRHWVRETVEAKDSHGEVHRGEAWGWSETDVEEAKQRARTSAERVADWMVRGSRDPAPSKSAEYLYSLDRPPREEIVQELHDVPVGRTDLGVAAFGEAPVEHPRSGPERLAQQDREVLGRVSRGGLRQSA